jgi:hypothetical protein
VAVAVAVAVAVVVVVGLDYLSRGNIIIAAITMKKTRVCKKKPGVVGQPELEAIVRKPPKIF